jgi:N-acetylmuramoyl-L-alanine amidase
MIAAMLLSPRSSPTPPEPSIANDRDAVAPAFAKHEIRCLARAIWHEARGEPLEGQIAVGEVIIARSKDRRWRGDLCRTIRMPNQFSFVTGGRTLPISDPVGAQRMMDLTRAIASGRLTSRAKGALYYHAARVKPIWRHKLDLSATIGHHVFYMDRASGA